MPSSQGWFDDETGQAAAEGGRFWLGYDDRFIYFAAKLDDSQPNQISATEYRTNVSLDGDDNIALMIDLGGSLVDFNVFGINPKGATSIFLAGGRAAKREWSGEFLAQARITPTGWEVEAKIPWRIMRLPAAGARTIRFNVERGHKRSQRDFVWRYTGSGRSDDHGRWTNVQIPVAPPERTFKLLPYTYAGIDSEGLIANAGLDLKTNLSDQIALVGSINPDFRNIENAILSLDFSRFERLAGETRPFFQEGSQYLGSALFASQRIERFDTGVNVHGRINDRLSFGVLDTVDFGNQNSFVSNVTFDPNSKDSYRVTATSMTKPGFHNEGYLFRYNRILGPMSLFLRTMGTKDTIEGEGVYNTASLNYSRNGLFVASGYDAVSPDFVPRLGFTPETNYKGFWVNGGYDRPLTKGPFQNINGSVFYQDVDRYSGGQYRKTLSADMGVTFRNRVALNFYEFQEDFLGDYDRLHTVRIGYPRGNPYRSASIQYDWGRLAQQNYRSVTAAVAYRPIDKIQLTAQLQHVDHFGRSDLGILGLNWDLGSDRYVSGRVVKRDEDWNAYLAFRKSGNRGIEYFLILGDPNARTFKSSLILKVVWPLQF